MKVGCREQEEYQGGEGWRVEKKGGGDVRLVFYKSRPLLWLLPLADTIVGSLQNTSYGVGDGGATQLWSQPPDSYYPPFDLENKDSCFLCAILVPAEGASIGPEWS